MPTQAKQGVAGKPALKPKKLPCEMNPDAFVPVKYTAKSTAEAKQLCRGCPDRPGCLEWVIGHEQPDGVYAAMTPKERDNLPDLLAAAGGDAVRVLRWFDDREALVSAQRIWQHGVSHAVAVQIVGVADLERARLVRRYAPELVEQVMSGAVTLRDAAVRASVVADGSVKGVAA